MTWIAPATGIAASAPRMPASSAPTSTETITASGESCTVLVDDEERHDDDARRHRVDEGNHADDHTGDGRAGKRDQVEERDDQAEGDRVRNTHDQQHDRDRPARDQADQEVARHIAADGPVDLVADVPHARLGTLREEREAALDPVTPFEQHEERQEDDRHRCGDRGDDAPRHADGCAREAEHLGRAALLHLLPHLLDDVVLRLEEAEAAAPVRDVLHVVGERLDEAVHLVDQPREERCAERDDRGDHYQVGERDRQPPPEMRPALQPVDERVEGEREEERDDEPRDHAAHDPDHLGDDRDRGDDEEDPEDRARTEVDDTLFGHGRSITAPPDVVTVRM